MSNKISPMTHNKLKTARILKHVVYYTGVVTEVQQISVA